jgi:hypothetical protein
MDKIKDNLPLVTLVLLLIGFTRLVAYYNLFHIDITSFIDFTEAIQLQFDFFTSRFLFLLFAMYLGIIPVIIVFRESGADEIKKPIGSRSKGKEKQSALVKRIKYYSIPIYFTCIAVLVIIIEHFVEKRGIIYPYVHDLYFSCFMFGLLSATMLYFIKLVPFSSQTKRMAARRMFIEKVHIISGGSMLVMLIGFSVLYSRISAFEVITQRPDYEVTLVLEHQTVVTNKNLIYVGKSKSYVFLYDKDENQAEVFPMDDIKQMYLRRGRINHKVPKRFRTENYRGPK